MDKKRVCPVEQAGILDNIFRRLIQNPKKILRNYIKKGMVVLDIGSGSGFFSREMAEMVGESGKVIAADLQKGMLKKLKEKIKGTEIEKRIELHKCEKNKIGISKKVDFVLIFYMLHEVQDKIKFFKEIKSILNPDGKVFLVEPKFHVSKKDFEKEVNYSKKQGLKILKQDKVFFSKAVILTN